MYTVIMEENKFYIIELALDVFGSLISELS